MGFQIHQREKTQGIDLLDRIAERLTEEINKLMREEDADYEDYEDAIDTVQRKSRELYAAPSPLDAQVPLDLATLAQLLRNFDDQKRGSAVEFFARYFSNFSIEEPEFLYAAGYALTYRDQLLREEEGERVGGDFAECECGCDGEARCSRHAR